MSNEPERETSAEDFVPLNRVAELLGMPRGELWKRLQDEGIELAYDRSSAEGEAASVRRPGLRLEVLASLGERWGRATHLRPDARPASRRLWKEVPEIEEQRDRKLFERGVLEAQIQDLRQQLELSEQAGRVARKRMQLAEADLDRELGEGPEREELVQRLSHSSEALRGAESRLAAALERCAELEQECARLRQQSEVLRRQSLECEDLRGENEALRRENGQLSLATGELRELSEHVKAQYEELRLESDELARASQELRAESIQSGARSEGLTQRMARLEQCNASSHRELERALTRQAELEAARGSGAARGLLRPAGAEAVLRAGRRRRRAARR